MNSLTKEINKKELPDYSLIYILLSVVMATYVLAKYNPFYIPTVDDSAIIMRYLKNFQTGHFYTYNVEDGPVFGISSFWMGLAAGFVSWLGLAPQASLIVVSFVFCIAFFYCICKILDAISHNPIVSIIGTIVLYFSSYFIPKTLFLGLETPLNLWLVCATFLFFIRRQEIAFFITAAICLFSKLDTGFIVAGLVAAQCIRSTREGNWKSTAKNGLLFFVLPTALCILATWLIFHWPVPQSFMSKFFFRPKAPRTSWFPFFEPMIDNPVATKSAILVGISFLWSLALALRKKDIFIPSTIFSLAALGTLFLYFIYNPGEKMPWYYPLPEFLCLMSVVCLPLDTFKIRNRSVAWISSLVAISLAGSILYLRYPMNADAISQAIYWQKIFEKERKETGELANHVAPKEHPVLWTGHGYPAYLFDGFVADYSGLNTRAIWTSLKTVKNPDQETTEFLKSMGLENAPLEQKAEYYLMKMYGANVFMQHSLFSAQQQRFLSLRLAGSFYAIDLANAPAFRVFVKDTQAPENNIPISLDGNPGAAANKLSATGPRLNLILPANVSRLLFGVLMTGTSRDVQLINDSGSVLGSCHVSSLTEAHIPQGVQACSIDIAAPSSDTINLHFMASDTTPIQIFEPTGTEKLAGKS